MSNVIRMTLTWAPRVLSLVFALFIGLFALDVFGHGLGFWRTAAAFLMHLIPSFVLLGMVALAWRWEWVGTMVSAALAALFLWWNFTVRHNAPAAVLIIAGPLFSMAALYLLAWWTRVRE